MAYQSLYRRYRPQRFSEIRGQPHIVTALRNAVAKNEVGHAYLFHGPRGTGKTTSARVLAKALNCENLGDDAEPCGTCESCVAIEEGRSFDLHELDAASNNRVEDMRDLLGKVSLGNPGRAKIYILDEVHMLTRGAENALLKTLEEPPDHVIWVLATTEPHKVVETIRSRCQVFELGLLGAEEMSEHVRFVVDDAGLDVDEAAIDHVVTVGGGSVRDTLSALDRVVAAGGVVEIDDSIDQLLSAVADRDAKGALTSVGDAMGRGKDPRTIGEAVVRGLRDAFLTAMGSPPPRLTAPEHARAGDLAERMPPAAMTRALETLGTALVEMRQAPDPRVDLEVALVRLCRPAADRSLDGLIERIERLEAGLADSAQDRGDVAVPARAPASVPPPPPAPPTEDPAEAAPRRPGVAAAARKALADAGGPPPTAKQATSVVASSPEPEAARDGDDGGLKAIQPESPRHVVRLAAEHLSLDRDVVVKRATELLGPADGPRPAADLSRLWVALLDEFASSSGIPSPPVTEPSDKIEEAPSVGDALVEEAPSVGDALVEEAPSVGDALVEEAPSVGDALVEDAPPVDEDAAHDIDLTDLIDAPDRAEEVIERLTEAFPGAELHTPEEPEP